MRTPYVADSVVLWLLRCENMRGAHADVKPGLCEPLIAASCETANADQMHSDCRKKREAEGKRTNFAEEMRCIEETRGSKLSGANLGF